MAGRVVMLFGVAIKTGEEEAVARVVDAVATTTEKKKKKKRKNLAAPHTQELPREYKEAVASMGGEDLKLIMGKRITATDLTKKHNRLNLPRAKIKQEFLKPEEKESVCKKRRVVEGRGRKDLYEGVEVTLLDPSLKVHAMALARWGGDSLDLNHNDNEDDADHEGEAENKNKNHPQKKSSWWLALKTDWVKIAADNALQEEDAVQIWAFRFKADARLGLVLHKVHPPATPTVKPAAPRRGRRESGDDHHQNRKRNKKTKTAAE